MKDKFVKLDLIKDIIFFLLYTAGMFAYCMLVLLIISFITTSFLHFTIEGIFIASIAGTVVLDIFYVVKKVRKRRKA